MKLENVLMNTTFKKSLLAVALSAAAMSAQAVTVSATATQLSFEGAANETSIALPTVTATIGTGVEYAAGDIITITVAGGKILAASVPALAFTPSGTQVGDTATITFLSKTETEIKFRVASVTEGGAVEAGITTGGTFALTGITLDRASVLATATNKVSVTYGAVTGVSNIVIDGPSTTGADKVNAVEVNTQLAATISRKLNGVVDVENDRKLFTNVTDTGAPADSTTKDTVSVAVTNTTTLNTPATLASVSYTVGGDFSWMDADKSGAVSTAELNAAFAYVATADDTVAQPTINAAMTEIKATATLVGAVDAEHDFQFTIPGTGDTKPVLSKQDFTVVAVANYTPTTGSATTKQLVSGSAGSWTLNGSTVVVPYMVHQYGKFSSILNVQNSGTKDGAISIDVWAEDGTVVGTNLPAGTSKAGSVVSVAKTAVDALVAKGYDLSKTTKYAVRIVTNVPASNVIVNSAYADVSQTTVTRTPVANDSATQTKGGSI
jgi:hypothetical protein